MRRFTSGQQYPSELKAAAVDECVHGLGEVAVDGYDSRTSARVQIDSIVLSWPMRHVNQAEPLWSRSLTGSPWNPDHEADTGGVVGVH